MRKVSFIVWGPILRDDIPGLSERVCRLLELSTAEVALCEVRDMTDPDAVTVEALARLQLLAQRRGCRVSLVNASHELHDLIAFMGLTDVIPG
ncbi:MAG TPA: STAS domain-containing protein [Actinomycetota bacterium]|nr:STAS domain-containing protein [Actinomycetota bacterium]